MATRRMALRLLLSAFFCIGICTAWVDERPILETRDGNLVISSAKDRNITLVTLGKSTVNINEINLVEVSLHAQKAARVVEKWQAGYLQDLTANVERLISAIEGPNGLQYRLNILEIGDNTLINSSTGITTPRESLINNGDQISTNDLLHLRNRVDKLENKLRTISRKLREDECATNPCKNGGTCIKIYNGFQCICSLNWEGPSCTEDVDECDNFAGTALGCQNGATCTNLPGSYRCSCSTGWHGIHCNTQSTSCNSPNSRKLCGHGDCVTTAGNAMGYTCNCDQGWKSEGMDPACMKDIDECVEGQSRCSLDPLTPCINLPGGYKCGSCPPGYTGNGHHCVDIDECLVDNGGCSMEPMVECENKIGSRRCGNCPPGYVGDGMTCTYVGVCKINNGGCHPRATCVENPSFTNLFPQCNCPDGYHGDGLGSQGCELLGSHKDDSCAGNPCIQGICISISTHQYYCICHDGFTGTHCESSIDPCSPNPCQNDGVCTSEDSKTIICECASNFSGPRCQSLRETCGGLFRNTKGSLRYPMSDEGLKGNLDCTYIIVVDKSKVLKITFLEFDVGSAENCESTFLQINDGDNDGAHQLGRYCNSNMPIDPSFTTTHNSVYLLLRSNKSTNRQKFFLSWDSVAPECGGFLTGDHGIISSPGSPGKYPHNRDCIWEVKVNPGKRIQFHFFSLKMEQHPTCDYDYLEINETTGYRNIQLSRFCNHSHPAPLLTSGSSAKVHFHSDADGSDMGFQMSYSTVEGVPGCGGVFTAKDGTITTPSISTQNLVCEWKIQLQQGLRVRLNWISFNLEPDGGCIYHSAEVFAGADTESPIVGRYCGNDLPATVTINSNVVLIVFTRNYYHNEHQGFQLNYKTICGAEFHEPSGIIKSLWYPDSYPEKNTCIYEIIQPPHAGIILSIVDMDIIGDPPYCYDDHLEIYDGENDKSLCLGKICGGTEYIPNQSYYSSLNVMYLKFTTYDGSSGNRGFLANYTTFNRDCGGIWNAPTGVIKSSMGNNDGRCMWIIKAPERHVIQITFETLDLYHQSSNCSDNFVAIYDGVIGSGQEIGRYCSTYPPVLTSQGNTMTIVHNSDNMEDDDVEAQYIFIDTTEACGGHYFSSTGLITTPNYPDPYPMHISCEWVITVPNKRQITLNVKDFLIAGKMDCKDDSLEVRAGGSEASILIGKYCGSSIPKTLKSFTNQMYLKFVSHSHDHGFSIEWDSSTFGCGGTLTGSNGEIFSPNYPQPYHHLASCVWKIRTNEGNLVRLVFVDFNVEDDRSCTSDYIEISSGVDGYRSNSKRYCDMPSSPVDLDSNLATIRFRSDHTNSGRGFHIKYKTLCVHKVRGFHGIIESPNFPNKYPGNANCSWIIEAPKGNKINLTFSHFNFPVHASAWGEYCPRTYLSVGEGANDSMNMLLSKSCYMDKYPEHISSTQNQMFLHFEADPYSSYEGFRLEWMVVGCGGHLTRTSGDLSSPGYPDAYSKSIECEWLIEVDRGHSVEINFPDVNLEKVEGCHSDRVELYGGTDANSPMLATLCHSESPVRYTSPTNKMFVKFIANTQISHGWKATYKSVELTCGGTFRAAKGIIHSAHYPLNYPINQNCVWLIQVDKNNVVNLTFVDFDIEDTTNCIKNYVKVFDGTSHDSSLLGTFCKNKLPPRILSTGNSILVVMRSDSQVTSKGFKAQFEKACGARIITNSTGVLEAAWDPQMSEINRHCTWIITASDPSDHVTISFSYMGFTTVWPKNCVDHYVRIYEGEGTDGPLRNIWCSNEIPLPFTSAGNALTIHLYGDNHDKFAATYSVLDSACGGEHLSAAGTIASPGYPNDDPGNAECVWLLKTSPGNGIRLTFVIFELKYSENCDSQYLEIREESAIGKLIGIYCDNEPSPIESLKNLWIKFKTDDRETGQVFMAKYFVIYDLELTGTNGEISSPLYPYPWNGEDIVSWRITVGYHMAIRVEFDDVHIDRDDTCMVNVAIYDGYDIEAPKIASVCGLLSPKDPIVSSSNVIVLQFGGEFNNRTENWFHLNWYQVPNDVSQIKNIFTKFSDCSVEYDLTSAQNSSVTFNSPGWPDGYSNDLDCIWVITSPPGYHLSMKLLAVDLESTENCVADYVAVYNGNGLATTLDNSQILKQACLDNEIDKTIQGNDVMTVKFHSDYFLRGSGFQAIVWRECGGKYSGPNGVINFDLMWSKHDERTSNITCEWYINVHRGRTIEVKFDEFSVGNYEKTGCHDNYILLKNGAESESPHLDAGKFCDQSRPPARLETTGNKLYVKAAGFLEQINFIMMYREVKMSCGGSVRLGETNPRVTFNSPNYPNIPPAFAECVWTFLAPAGERLTLHFVDRFDLTTSLNCTKEYVEVRDGGTEHSESLGTYCGNTLPISMTTTGNMMYVHFYTDVSDPKNGFNATVTSGEVCGRLLRSETGVVKSPDYPYTYPIDQECSWTIVGPPDHTLTMEFYDLDLPAVDNCEDTDYVKISQKRLFDTTVNELGRWCGTDKPSLVETSSNIATVSFHSDNKADASYRGFRLNYTASKETCGGIFDGTTGYFATTGYPNPSMSSRSCKWSITVPEGSHVVVSMRDINDVRQRSRLTFYNDKHAKSEIKKIGEIPFINEVFSSSNYMLIVYQSIAGHRGFEAWFKAFGPAPCGGFFDNEIGSLLPPTSPFDDLSFFCQWKLKAPDSIIYSGNGTTLSLSVSGFLGEYSRQSRSCEDRMKYISISDGQHKIGMVCGDVTNDTIIFRSPSPVNIINLMNGTLGGRVSFEMNYTWKACGGILTGPSHTISSHENISYPRSCVWQAKYDDPGAVISMNINRINLGHCGNGYILVRNGGPLSPIIDTYCGNIRPDIIISTTNQLWIEYMAVEPPGDFEFQLNLVSGSCGGSIRGSSKEITSPGFPKQYPNNAECTWEITVDLGYTVGFIFVDRFNLETSYQCTNDFVQIFSWGPNAMGISGWDDGIKYCGRNAPSAFNSTSNRVKVLFRSNNAIQGDGFRARWQQNCGGVFEATGQVQLIHSPHYPDAYPSNQICNYTIQAPQGKEMLIGFTDLEIEGGDSFGKCKFDNITILGNYDSPYHSDLYSVICGDKAPTFMYMRDKVYIIFQSDAQIQKRGYRFQYMLTECGGVITKPSQINPPGRNFGEYFGRLNCTWIIRAPEKKSVVLRFQKLHIPSSRRCNTDVLRVVEGDTLLTLESLTKICGTPTDPFPPVKSIGNVMTVMLRSDGTNGIGQMSALVIFSNNEASGCGGRIRLTTSIPFTTQKTAMYEPFEDCQWRITVESGKHVRLSINRMDLKNSTNVVENINGSCNGDYLEVRDGSDFTSDLIGRYCGKIPQPITSSTDALWIRFVTDGSIEGEGVSATLEPIDSLCGKHFWEITDKTVVIESPGYPEDFPAGIQCEWIFKNFHSLSQIRIHFDIMDMEETENCDGDRLEITHQIIDYIPTDSRIEDSLFDIPLNRYSDFRTKSVRQPSYKYCGKNTSMDHYSDSNMLHVLLKTTTKNLPKPRKFKFEVEKALCNRNYTAEQGRIIHREFEECSIMITAPPNYTISLYFNYYTTNRRPCSNNFLKVYDGDFGSNETIICGAMDAHPIFSTGNKLILHAKSISHLSYAVPIYDIQFTTTDKGRGCGGKLYNYDGVFTSPMYPSNYRNVGSCKWEINVPHGYTVGLKFLNFDLGTSDTCSTDYLKIQEENNVGGRVEVYCSREVIEDYTANTNRLTVVYVSSVNNTGTGWKIRFTATLANNDDQDSSDYIDFDYD